MQACDPSSTLRHGAVTRHTQSITLYSLSKSRQSNTSEGRGISPQSGARDTENVASTTFTALEEPTGRIITSSGSACVELILDEDFDTVIRQSESHAREFRVSLARNITNCLAIEPERVRVTHLSAGSIKATVEISAGGKVAADTCVLALAAQAADASSPLRRSVVSVVSARVLKLACHSAPPSWNTSHTGGSMQAYSVMSCANGTHCDTLCECVQALLILKRRLMILLNPQKQEIYVIR